MTALLSEDAQLLDCLRQAGHEAVERKRRLGQYAVVWRDGAPAFIGPNPPSSTGQYKTARSSDRPFAGVQESDKIDDKD